MLGHAMLSSLTSLIREQCGHAIIATMHKYLVDAASSTRNVLQQYHVCTRCSLEGLGKNQQAQEITCSVIASLSWVAIKPWTEGSTVN